MNSRISLFLLTFSLTLAIAPLGAQKLKKSDKTIIAHLSSHVNHFSYTIAAGEAREKAAMDYIVSQFQLSGIEPKGDNGSYIHSFEIPEGIEIGEETFLSINGSEIKKGSFFPLLESPVIALETSPSLSLPESGEPWFYDLKELFEDSAAGINTREFIIRKALEVKQKGCTALFIYNTSEVKDGISFNGEELVEKLPIPVIYITQDIAKKYFSDETAMLDLKLNVSFTKKTRKGKYVVGFINNNGPKTIMIGTHESADNNAALIEVGNLLKAGKAQKNNYLLVAFFDKVNNVLEVPADNYMIDVIATADTEKLNYIYTIVEKAK